MLFSYVESDSDFDLPVKRSSMFQRSATALQGSVRRVRRVFDMIKTKTVFGGTIDDSSDAEDSTAAVYNYPSSNRIRQNDEDDIFF